MNRLSEEQRAQRYASLQQATALHEPPVVSEAGLLDLAGSGELPAEFLGIMRASNVHVQIEVTTGRSVRGWKSWVGYERAIVISQPGPVITTSGNLQDLAERPSLTPGDCHLQVVAPGWVPVDALHWLGFAPAAHPECAFRLPLQALFARFADPGVPPPDGEPGISGIWDRPMRLCTVTADPAGYCAHLLDTGETGAWLLNADHGAAVLSPLAPRAVWRLLLALTASGSGRQPDPSFVAGSTSGKVE